MKKHFVLPLLVAVSLLLGGCATYTDVRQHKELTEEAQHIGSIVILPPEVAIELITFTGENERETQKQDSTTAQLMANARNALEAQGLTVIDYDFIKAGAEHSELAFALTQCGDALKKAEKTLYNKPVESKNKDSFSESIGASANTIAELTGADALLLIDYQGFEKSSGMIAKDVIAGALLGALTGTAQIAPSAGSSLKMALIAANSGNVLWVNRKAVPALDTSALKLVMSEFPKPQWRQVPASAIAQAPEAEQAAPVPAAEGITGGGAAPAQ